MVKIGTTVVLRYPTAFNGVHEHPALVNRVWNDGTHAGPGAVAYVNTTMFPDCGAPQCVTSVAIFDTEENARAYSEKNYNATVGWLA